MEHTTARFIEEDREYVRCTCGWESDRFPGYFDNDLGQWVFVGLTIVAANAHLSTIRYQDQAIVIPWAHGNEPITKDG